MKRWVPWVIVLLVAAVGCAPSAPAQQSSSGSTAVNITGPAVACPANFAAATGTGTHLPKLTLSCLRDTTSVAIGGKPAVPTIINLWAAWCDPCRTEMPLLQQLHTKFGDALQVLGVVTNDTRSSASSFTVDEGITFPNLLDSKAELETKLKLVGLPNTVFVDAKGDIVYVHNGPFTSAAQLEDAVSQYLKVSAP